MVGYPVPVPTTKDDQPLLLPPRSLLFYIGSPKTGTTTVQLAAARAREKLLANGVYYPGTGPDHRRQVYAFMGKRIQRAKTMVRGAKRSSAAETPSMSEWLELMADIASQPDHRIFISCEEAARCSDALAAKFVHELGRERTHIAITLRPPAAVLPSQWIELLKGGQSLSFNSWLEQVYGKSDKSIPESMKLYLDMSGLVERWAKVAGPGNVTVILSDRANHDFLTDSFEQLLGLPGHTLTGAVVGGDRTNRSMTFAEAEVFRAVNAEIYKPAELSWPLYLDVIQSGAIRRVLGHRNPSADERRVLMPEWAAEIAVREGESHAKRIAESGVRIVGDLASLYEAPRVATEEESAAESNHRAIAVQALIGAMNGAAKSERDATRQIAKAKSDAEAAIGQAYEDRDRAQRERDEARKLAAGVDSRSALSHHQAVPGAANAQAAATSFTTKDLARAIALRLSHRIFTGKSLELK